MSPPHHTFLFPRLKIKLKGCHCGTVEVIEAESQAVLNTLTGQDFQDSFKHASSTGNNAYSRKGSTSKVMVTSRPKVRFLPDGSTSPGNYGRLSVINRHGTY
jgi:hypothetical protein